MDQLIKRYQRKIDVLSIELSTLTQLEKEKGGELRGRIKALKMVVSDLQGLKI